MSLRARFGDAIAVLLLAGLGFAAGRSAFAGAPARSFYQGEFGPAVMVAIGQGFTRPEMVPGGFLENFLLTRTATLDRTAVDVTRLIRPNQFQSGHRYLLTAVGYWWRLTAIDWQRVADVAGVLYAMAIVSVFTLLRLFVPLPPALAGAFWFAASPLQLTYVPHLRDFAKGAFVLAAVPFVVALVLRARSWRALAGLGAGAGVVIGVGLGFRMDVAIMAPVTVACIVLFRGRRPWTDLGHKAVSIAALLLAITVTAWPVLTSLSTDGSNAIHVVLLGYSDSFDARLKIGSGPYSMIAFYSDNYLHNLLQVRSVSLSGMTAPMPSAAYDAAAFDLWTQWLRMFPADVVTRLFAAVDGVLDLAFENPPTAAASAGFFEWLNGWRGWGWVLGVLTVAAGARLGASAAMFAAVLLTALAGYSSLQYDPRHYFHLQAIPITIMVVLLWRGLSLVRTAVFDGSVSAAPTVTMRRAAAVTAIVLMGLVLVPTIAAREFQRRHLGEALTSFLSAERHPLDVEFVPLAGNRWLARWPDVHGLPSGAPGLRSSYYLAEFRADGPRSVLAIGLRYSAAPDWSPCALTRRLVTAAGPARFGFPVYSREGDSAFEGIEMGGEMRSRLLGIYRLPAGPAGLPVELRLASDWPTRRLFQRLAREDRFGSDDVGVGMTSVGDQCGSEIAAIDALLGPDASRAPAGEVGRPVSMAKGDALAIQIQVDAGKAAIGLMQTGTWVSYGVTSRPGLSIVIVRAPEAGVFIPFVADGEPALGGNFKFSIDRMQVVRSAGRAMTGDVSQ